MKKINIILSLMLLFTAACKKDHQDFVSGATINVVHVAVGVGAVKVNAGGGDEFSYAKSEDVGYGSNRSYAALSGNKVITLVSSADTNMVLIKGNVGLPPISTLYLIGTSTAIDTMYRVEKNLPYIRRDEVKPDSSVYVRIVNLSPNSTPVNVNIKSTVTPIVNEVSGLGYKQIAAFKKYPAKTTTPNYVFEVRDAVSNAVLSSYTLNANNNRHKTVALIIKGVVGGTGGSAFGISQINYY